MKMYSVVGNKKKVTMESNPTKLKIVGNNCIIRVATNQGDIEVIGNDCRVEITNNYGTVNLVGGNGFINITKRWKGDKVHMMGPCNYMAVAGKKKTSQSFEGQAQLSPFSKDLDDVIESIFSFVMR